jgi:hypothetical protein
MEKKKKEKKKKRIQQTGTWWSLFFYLILISEGQKNKTNIRLAGAEIGYRLCVMMLWIMS